MGIRKIPVNFGKIEDDLSLVLSNSQSRFNSLRKNKQVHPFPQQEVFFFIVNINSNIICIPKFKTYFCDLLPVNACFVIYVLYTSIRAV